MHKSIDDRALEVLWVVARNGHATEKVITATLRAHGMGVKNRGQLYRSLKLLLQHNLIAYDKAYGEYTLQRKEAYARKEQEEQAQKYRRELWSRIKDEHEFQRAFGTPP